MPPERPPLPFFHRAPLRTALVTLGAISLTACANFSGIQPLARLIDATPLGLQASYQPAAPASAAEAAWWKTYQDAQLDGLIEQALANNPSLRVAQTRLARMQALQDTVASVDGPKLNADFNGTRQLYTANGMIPPPIAGHIYDSASLQASASWELDFFGKNRSALEAALGQVQAAEADAMAARQLLATSVARNYFALMRVHAQWQVAAKALALREQTRALVKDRVNAGLDTQLELQQAESGLPEARLQMAQLEEQQTLAQNALAALTAQAATALKLQWQALPAVPATAATQTLPIDLLGRRMDIAASRWRIESALKDVDAAKAQFYPNINLTAFAGYSSLGFDKLFKTGSDQWGVGPAIRLPLFDGGRLRANLRSKTVDVDAAVESYNAQVLEAVHEVADRLASSQAIVQQQKEQAATQAAAETALQIALARYQAGLGNYLQVLSAEAPVLAQRRLAVDLAARAVDTHVQLMHAIGGTAPTSVALAATPSSSTASNALAKAAP